MKQQRAFWAIAICSAALALPRARASFLAIGVPPPEAPPGLPDVPASGPPPAATAGLGVGLPAAGALAFAAVRRSRRRRACPLCHSHHGADVGPVGGSRNCRRCHACGNIWDLDDPEETAAP